ncbi:MAG: hypothetical protein FWD61_03305 [Phycisphaerales bacterium]|nr:hypothetical protein [Phycisphaerales bacterium]
MLKKQGFLILTPEVFRALLHAEAAVLLLHELSFLLSAKGEVPLSRSEDEVGLGGATAVVSGVAGTALQGTAIGAGATSMLSSAAGASVGAKAGLALAVACPPLAIVGGAAAVIWWVIRQSKK